MPLPQVTQFKYLGSIIQKDGKMEGDVYHRIEGGVHLTYDKKQKYHSRLRGKNPVAIWCAWCIELSVEPKS